MKQRAIKALTSLLAVFVFTPCSGGGFNLTADPRPVQPPDTLILQEAQTIILVRVVEEESLGGGVTLLVLKSWRGPFFAGRVIHAETPTVILCRGGGCPEVYRFKAGDSELLIFTSNPSDPAHGDQITVWQDHVWPAAESQAQMEALDRAVKEEQVLQDPQTDIARAPEQHRVMLALRDCFADAADDITAGNYFPYCHMTVKLSVLNGIKRSDLVAYWGSPTSCLDDSNGMNYAPPTEADCARKQAAIWTFGHPGNNLWCNGDLRARAEAQVLKDPRCMSFSWDSRPTHADYSALRPQEAPMKPH